MDSLPTDSLPQRTYTERRAEAQAELRRLDRVSARYANVRGVVFLAAAALLAALLFGEVPRTPGGWGVAALVALYGGLAVLHGGVFRREARARLLEALNARGLARLGGGWHAFPERGERFQSPEHLYTPDLDVFGQGSLFQLINETATRAGEERLAAWLSAPASTPEVRARQEAARELAPALPFRQALCVEGATLAREKANPAAFIRWAEGGPSLGAIRWARPLALLLPLLTLALFVAGRFEVVPRSLWWAGLLAQLAVAVVTRRPLREMEESLSAGEYGFVRYAPLFALLESHPFTHPALARLQAGLEAPGQSPVSHHLRAFSRRYSFVEFKRHQFHPVVHLFTLWDVHALFALERWRERHGPQVRHWFEALAEMEALGCLAGFTFDRPDFAFPELVSSGGPCVVAEALGHPLLEAPVRNDVALPGPGHALLVTGSNMSGKTTLLRALGLNAVLALAGAPVCARALRLSPLQVLTSMRVKDSLERGVSYFYAEVQRIKAVLDAAGAARGQALFLLDEVLLGTNTRERQIASREVLRLLLGTGACGAVTTHDLSLAALAEEYPGRVRNVHFRDQLVEGRMTFDYRLREGVVDTTNALRVLRAAGVPVAEGGTPAA